MQNIKVDSLVVRFFSDPSTSHQSSRLLFKNAKDFARSASILSLIFDHSIFSCNNSLLSSSAEKTILFDKLNMFSIDLNRPKPLDLLPMATNGLLKIIEKAVPWKESVTTNDESRKALSH